MMFYIDALKREKSFPQDTTLRYEIKNVATKYINIFLSHLNPIGILGYLKYGLVIATYSYI